MPRWANWGLLRATLVACSAYVRCNNPVTREATTHTTTTTTQLTRFPMPDTAISPPAVVNRLRAVLLHVPFYSIEPVARLALDTGVSKAAISRTIRGKCSPSYLITERIARAVSRRSGKVINAHEIFSTDGAYPTPSTCQLLGCGGCLPPEAWDERSDKLRPAWRHTKPGGWSRFEPDPTSPGTAHLIDIS